MRRKRLRHAAALALVGWYLLSPPPNRHGPFETDKFREKDGRTVALRLFTYDFSAPWSKWNGRDYIFESKTYCEAVRNRFRKSVQDKQWIDSDPILEKLIAATKCFAPDDPRLGF
jgi:hypothetical protein